MLSENKSKYMNKIINSIISAVLLFVIGICYVIGIILMIMQLPLRYIISLCFMNDQKLLKNDIDYLMRLIYK